jgi:hypothetical protein
VTKKLRINHIALSTGRGRKATIPAENKMMAAKLKNKM